MPEVCEEVSVSLNLEESGWLCHALMKDDSFRNAVLTGRGTQAHQRMAVLYAKLSNANDVLMGKA